MRLRFTIRDLLWLCVILAAGCGSAEPEPGVKIASVSVGTFDSDGDFASTETMPFRVGAKYGYRLSVSSTSGKVKVKEVLDLPQPAIWDDDETTSAEVMILEIETLNGGKTHAVSYELNCGDKMAIQDRIFTITEADPKGKYRFSIYLDDQLTATEELQVE